MGGCCASEGYLELDQRPEQCQRACLRFLLNCYDRVESNGANDGREGKYTAKPPGTNFLHKRLSVVVGVSAILNSSA